MMWGYGGLGEWAGVGWAMMGLMALFGLLVTAGVVLLIVWAVRMASGGGHHQTPWSGEERRRDAALEIARQRLARGEISAEEFEELRRKLGH